MCVYKHNVLNMCSLERKRAIELKKKTKICFTETKIISTLGQTNHHKNVLVLLANANIGITSWMRANLVERECTCAKFRLNVHKSAFLAQSS